MSKILLVQGEVEGKLAGVYARLAEEGRSRASFRALNVSCRRRVSTLKSADLESQSFTGQKRQQQEKYEARTVEVEWRTACTLYSRPFTDNAVAAISNAQCNLQRTVTEPTNESRHSLTNM